MDVIIPHTILKNLEIPIYGVAMKSNLITRIDYNNATTQQIVNGNTIVNLWGNATINVVGNDITCSLPNDSDAELYIFNSDSELDYRDTLPVVSNEAKYTFNLALAGVYAVIILGNQSKLSGIVEFEVI